MEPGKQTTDRKLGTGCKREGRSGSCGNERKIGISGRGVRERGEMEHGKQTKDRKLRTRMRGGSKYNLGNKRDRKLGMG